MPKISAFQREKYVTFEWPNSLDALHMTVYPDRFTGAKLSELQSRVSSEEDNEMEQHKFLCDFLAYLIGSWDLENDDGSPVKIDGETLFNTLPVTLVAALLESIRGELTVDPQTPES